MTHPKTTMANASVPPLTREAVEEAFRWLQIPATVSQELWEWGATPERVQPVVRFLHRVRFWQEGQVELIALGRQVYGRSRDAHYDLHPEELGVLAKLNNAVEEVSRWIRRAIALHQESPGAVYDHRIAAAWPHMEAVLAALEDKYFGTLDTWVARAAALKMYSPPSSPPAESS